MVVELLIHGGAVNLNVRMRLGQASMPSGAAMMHINLMLLGLSA